MKLLFMFFISIFSGLAQGLTTQSQIDDVSLLRPTWANYWGTGKEDDRQFDIQKLMAQFSLSRLQAIETQVEYRLSFQKNLTQNSVDVFNASLEASRNGQFDHLNEAKLKAASFIVVFDLDETAYDQKIKPENASCADVSYKDSTGKDHLIRTAPHVVDAFREIVKLGGAVVIFSANRDSLTKDNLTAWKVDGQSLLNSDLIAAVLTENSLVLQAGTSMVLTPSKDLRMLDETLNKVVIVDDNPTRLFQWKNEKLIRTFDGNLYCTTIDPALKTGTEHSMLDFISEIKEAVTFVDTHPGTTFQTAFLPFTIPGETNVQWLMNSGNFKTPAQVRDYIRLNSQIVTPKYP